MREYDAVKLVATAMRDQAVHGWGNEIRALEHRIRCATSDKINSKSMWFPFREKGAGGHWNCGAGVAIWTASEAAQRLANLTGRPASFWFNDVIHTMEPR